MAYGKQELGDELGFDIVLARLVDCQDSIVRTSAVMQ
jgi:hypothetical protein